MFGNEWEDQPEETRRKGVDTDNTLMTAAPLQFDYCLDSFISNHIIQSVIKMFLKEIRLFKMKSRSSPLYKGGGNIKQVSQNLSKQSQNYLHV